MADIRIKDFTTTDSTTRTGDFLPIDGTTGTRKLSAFSPTFGGNATVTGNLTVNGTGNSSFAGQLIQVADPATIALWKDATPTKAARFQFNTLADNGFSLGVYDGSSWFNAITVAPTTGVVKVPSTSASTTTSSGALVVGNGTSGGLGVGGSVNIHNNLTLGYASAGDSVLKIIRSSGGNEWLQIAGWSAGSLGNNAYSIDAVNGAGARPVYFRRSTDAGSTYTNFLTWDTSNNATFGGGVTISGGDVVRDGVAGAFRTYRVLSSNLGRWAWGADNASETGSNAGSNFVIYSFNDAGSVLTNPALRIDRASSNVLLAGDFLQSSSTNFNISSAGTNGNVYIKSNGGVLYLNNTAGNGDIRLGNTGTVAYVIGTSNSSSTSSGALVVSGGVGVGGNLSIGGDVLIDKSAIEVLLKRGANTNDGLIKFQTGILGDFAIGNRGTSDSDLHIYNYGTAADALKIAKSDSLATFAAAIRTAAPSGGTAANWKLGTVATVSPTSPNRTIEVDIGGTIYYIHAKTTNN